MLRRKKFACDFSSSPYLVGFFLEYRIGMPVHDD